MRTVARRRLRPGQNVCNIGRIEFPLFRFPGWLLGAAPFEKVHSVWWLVDFPLSISGVNFMCIEHCHYVWMP